jgi:hypothetical protein
MHYNLNMHYYNLRAIKCVSYKCLLVILSSRKGHIASPASVLAAEGLSRRSVVCPHCISVCVCVCLFEWVCVCVCVLAHWALRLLEALGAVLSKQNAWYKCIVWWLNHLIQMPNSGLLPLSQNRTSNKCTCFTSNSLRQDRTSNKCACFTSNNLRQDRTSN